MFGAADVKMHCNALVRNPSAQDGAKQLGGGAWVNVRIEILDLRRPAVANLTTRPRI